MKVAVIGGGYAGMAAAVTFAQRGVPVTVFEAAARLGGRARRVDSNGLALDNGLHLLIGAYRETLRLIDLVDAGAGRSLMRIPFDWRIHRRFRLRMPALPAPLHLVAGIASMQGANWSERIAAVRFVHAMRAARYRIARDTSVAELLAAHRQGASLTRHLWNPLCLAALNTPPEIASARVFLNVLRDSLGAARDASELVLARRDLSALFPEPAAEYVRSRGGEVRLSTTVERLSADGPDFLLRARGAELRFTHVVCAVAPHQLHALIAGLPALAPVAQQVAAYDYQPICTVYLQYAERLPLPAPVLGLADGLTQWVFDREQTCGQRGLAAAVISADGPHRDLTQDELARHVHAELAAHFGPLAAPIWHRVITEKRATFACIAGVERPPQSTALRNFYLAGDYTDSDYPATIESAVRSGISCAHAALG